MNEGIKDREGNIIKDRNEDIIHDGDFVSLAGNLTADDSFGTLPNGWSFGEEDIYQVYFAPEINTWGLKMEVGPDSPYNIKYLNHAVGLLHEGEVTIIKK